MSNKESNSTNKPIVYDIIESRPHERGIWRQFKIKSYTNMVDVEEFLNQNKDKWVKGYYQIRPLYNPDKQIAKK